MKIQIPFKIYQLFRIWRLEYHVIRAKKSLEALRQFTAGRVMEHPYSIVFASLQDRLNEAEYEIVMLEAATDWKHYTELQYEYVEAQTRTKFDVLMKETNEFLRNLGPDFQVKLNEETDGALKKWLKTSGIL